MNNRIKTIEFLPIHRQGLSNLFRLGLAAIVFDEQAERLFSRLEIFKDGYREYLYYQKFKHFLHLRLAVAEHGRELVFSLPDEVGKVEDFREIALYLRIERRFLKTEVYQILGRGVTRRDIDYDRLRLVPIRIEPESVTCHHPLSDILVRLISASGGRIETGIKFRRDEKKITARLQVINQIGKISRPLIPGQVAEKVAIVDRWRRPYTLAAMRENNRQLLAAADRQELTLAIR